MIFIIEQARSYQNNGGWSRDTPWTSAATKHSQNPQDQLQTINEVEYELAAKHRGLSKLVWFISVQ